jgi:hypothetical protein
LPGANGLTGGAVRDPRIGFVSGELAALLVSHFSRDDGAGFGVAFFLSANSQFFRTFFANSHRNS